MFGMTAEVYYEYTVEATSNIFIIKRERYDELTSQDKFVPEKQVTKSSSGPVSISMRRISISRYRLGQRLPVQLHNCINKRYQVPFRFLNERSGSKQNKITLKDVVITFPPQFNVITGDTSDKCDFCRRDGAKNEYSLAVLYGKKDGEQLAECPGEPTANTNPDEEVKILEKIYTCSIKPIDKAIDEVYFQKPFNVVAKVDYGYTYSKDVSFSVRSTKLNERRRSVMLT